MKSWMVAAVLCGAWLVPAAAPAQDDLGLPPGRTTWTFHGDRKGQAPDDFKSIRVGGARDGRWRIQGEKGAPSGSKVLMQLDLDPAPGRNLFALVRDLTFRDVTLSVQCKAVSGQTARAAGLVLRYQDERGYYRAWVDALEGMVRLDVLRAGKRRLLAEQQVEVAQGTWSQLRVDAHATDFDVFWNGKHLLECQDETLTYSGQIGLWTKDDSVFAFDDVSADPTGR
ncbi:MAG: hypothetical protein HY814_09235 [Candidatus Riflebacteria bacterium]|nr:hypothetical protein [Candidatus Riflebacteria bacterium]